MTEIVFTIGHSTHRLEHFVALLKQHQVEVIYDVRSAPYSRYNPQYNREDLKASLAKHGIAYMFAGDRLGARSNNPAHYVNGKVQYDRLAQSERFKQGIEAVCEVATQKRVVLMCAEKDPIDCHRAILVCRHLCAHVTQIVHFRADGSLETHDALEKRLMQKLPAQIDMFTQTAPNLDAAYDSQGDKIAYVIQHGQPARRAPDTEDYDLVEVDA